MNLDLFHFQFKLFLMISFCHRISESEPFMLSAGLEVEPSKCVVFHDRRSGNNWYKGRKNDSSEVFIQWHSLPLCQRDTNYKYLGKSLSF